MPNAVAARSTCLIVAPSSSNSSASFMYGSSTRLTRKPGPSFTTLVARPRITSTSGICRTGLKKWRPQNCSGRVSPAASSLIGIVEVFEHSTAWAASSGSSRSYSACFASAFS
jgi:hypothetical protein